MDGPKSVTQPWTVARLLAWTREHFERRAVESPRLCAEILLADAMACERIELYTRHESVPDADVLGAFRENVRKAADGAPIAYLIGRKEFFSLAFEVTPDVLIPRPETEILVERAISAVKAASGGIRSILDVGTGSGCMAIALATHLPDVAIHASDVSDAALGVARRNAEKHGVAGRIDFRAGDLFEPWDSPASFDMIVANPPYIGSRESEALPGTVRDFEPHLALFSGDDGLTLLRRMIAEAPGRLSANGHFLTEVAYNQAPAVAGLLNGSGFADIVTYKDLARHERVVHARRPAGESTQVA